MVHFTLLFAYPHSFTPCTNDGSPGRGTLCESTASQFLITNSSNVLTQQTEEKAKRSHTFFRGTNEERTELAQIGSLEYYWKEDRTSLHVLRVKINLLELKAQQVEGAIKRRLSC